MAGIIKKQILKHLSRFTKNLSPDKINLSTLKGEGQLSNLELDEEVLQNMLDLPTWLSITRVYCNKAAIRIQWTKLKTSPICLFLDKVEVEMMTCEEPRPPNGPSPIAITAGQSEYGFAEKVVEGMSVIINAVIIKVTSRAFHASFELWQLQGCSLNPKWQRSDLRYTRITHPKRGEVLTFKEINWQSLRIEADAIESEDQDLGNTPLRLITNQGRLRIALKRRVKDCNVLASKLLFILDDLLWVLTDSQLKAVIHYAKSLSEAMDKSAQQRKNMETAPLSPGPRPLGAEPPPAPVTTPSTLAQYFDLYDVKESSYHMFISRLDLHICNDSSSEPVDCPVPGSQGAMQLTFRKLGFDYYPFHRPGDGCRHWERHCSSLDSGSQWASKLLQDFQKNLESSGFPEPPSEPGGSSMNSTSRTNPDGDSGVKVPPDPDGSALKKLRSSCMVVRVDDLDIHQVSTGGRKSKKTQSLLCCNRKSLSMAENIPAIHLQFTEYYFPHSTGIPAPSSSLYGQLNGLQLCVDAASVLWMCVFCRGLISTLEQVKAFYHLQDSSRSDEILDIRVDATQLKLIVPLDSSILDHPDRPRSLSFSLSQAFLSNTRHSPHSSLSDLYSCFSSRPFFCPAPSTAFPRDRNIFHPLPPGVQNPDPSPRSSRDVWSLSVSRAAGSFDGAQRGGKTFLEPCAVCVWMFRPNALTSSLHQDSDTSSEKLSNQSAAPVAAFHFLVQSITPIRMWLNHYQYVALLRMKDYLARLGADLGHVQGSDASPASPPAVCVCALMEALEVGLLFPPVTEPDEAPEDSDTQSVSGSSPSPAHRNSGSVEDQHADEAEGEGSVEEAYEAVEEGPDDNQSHVSAPVSDPTPALSPADQNTSTVSLEGELSNALTATKDVTKDALSASLGLTKGALSITKDALSVLSRGSAMIFNTQNKELDDPSLRLQPLKHSSSQNSCDSVVMETSTTDDGLSLDSDTSENFIILPDSDSSRPNGTPVHSVRTDGGSSADLSSSVSHSTEELSDQTVCVLVLSLRGVSSVMELQEEKVVMATEVQSLTPKQLGNQKLLDLPALAHGVPSAPVSPRSRPPVVCMRVEAGTGAESSGMVEVRVRGCEAELLSSTLGAIGPFVEDELSVDPQPIRISVHNSSITLKDDGPRVYPTAPQSVPVSFLLDGVVLERLDDTVLTLRPTASQSEDRACCAPEEQDKIRSLQAELSDVQSSLSAALTERERLLQEIHKYDPTFTL
ncbi:bridge-like lipid transfer protein family member 3A [Trichomycterus rosablanca]|uniref:bridge-like lipid transfer protein family member 3A n=1 Tax=Trichomycterus rosablanca TaxID=2290929 RepID=UPI002F35F6D6